ncbi:MAG: alpha/beta hydrolase-fold protein, partial [Oscillospiraceae bacterium]|nr:alpha/beta hydrolase-fold protein [Oscillospiraceae bacterium]
MAHISMKTFSRTLHTKADIEVILPTPLTSEMMGAAMGGEAPSLDYYSDELRIPVLYLYHGTFGDDNDWMRFSRIESYAQQYNIAIVMPGAENSCFRNMPRGGPQYYDYMTTELPQIINWTFPVSRRREDTFVAGLSMGAFGAFYIGMSKPETFSHVACLSGAYAGFTGYGPNSFWALAFSPDEKTEDTDEDCYYLSEKLKTNDVQHPNLYICCGTEDFLYEENQRFR